MHKSNTRTKKDVVERKKGDADETMMHSLARPRAAIIVAS